MFFKCETVITTSTSLQILISISCLVSSCVLQCRQIIDRYSILSKMTFMGCSISGLLLILAPEEPSLKLGGGADYALFPGAVLIALAVFAVIISVIGCLSVASDSRVGLCCYSAIGFIIVFIAIACASILFSFAYSGMISSRLNDTMWKDLQSHLYNETDLFKIQVDYECCGVNHYNDWLDKSTNWSPSEKQYPSTCCHDNSASACDEQDVYTKGCRDVLLTRLRIVVDASFGAALTGAIIQAIAATLSCYGSTLIKKYQTYDIL